jgi:hypothetical protein
MTTFAGQPAGQPFDSKGFAEALAGATEDNLLRAIEGHLPKVWKEVQALASQMTSDEALKNRLIRSLMPWALCQWLRSNCPKINLDELCKRYCELLRKYAEEAKVISELASVLLFAAGAADVALTAGMLTASAAFISLLLAKICKCRDAVVKRRSRAGHAGQD